MADGEAERESDPGPDLAIEIYRLEDRLQELERCLREAGEEAEQAATEYCQRFCQTLLEYAEKWKANENSLPVLEVYIVAIQNYAKARPYLTSDCENVAIVLERLAFFSRTRKEQGITGAPGICRFQLASYKCRVCLKLQRWNTINKLCYYQM